jgi:hypothetical protein
MPPLPHISSWFLNEPLRTNQERKRRNTAEAFILILIPQFAVFLGSQYNLSPLPTISDHRLPACFSFPLYCNPLQRLPPSFMLSSSFLVPSIAAAAICLGMCWFYTLPKRPYHLSRRDFINCAVSGPCDMSFISIFVLIATAFSFFYKFLHFPRDLPFKYSERVRFLRGNYYYYCYYY